MLGQDKNKVFWDLIMPGQTFSGTINRECIGLGQTFVDESHLIGKSKDLLIAFSG